MPKRDAPEFYWDEKRARYRKRIRDEQSGRWVSVYGRTKEECRANARDKAAALAEASRAAVTPYVYEYAAKWYALHTAELSQKRKDDYRNAINNHICPVIGQKLLTEVTADDIAALMLQLSGTSQSLQQKVVTTLKRVFKSAVKNKLIAESPCDDLKAGGYSYSGKIPLSKTQQRKLLDAVEGTRAELFVELGLYTGLRREEILGLQWDAIHLQTAVPYLEVKRAVKWDGRNQPIISDVLKSSAAYRSVPLPPKLIDSLAATKETTQSDFVVCSASGGALSAASFRRLWDVVRIRSVRDVERVIDGKTVVEQLRIGDVIPKHQITITLDFDVTPHQLRHTYITELILSGANIKTVQYLAGHRSVQLTLDIYTKLMANRPEDTIHAVLGAFGAPDVVPNASSEAKSIDNPTYSDNRQ